ncbi:MAG: hypothetical protein JWR86_1296, partial [Enterovirga sp.]|nr:hypothetical protein [Enterovirga sp.]
MTEPTTPVLDPSDARLAGPIATRTGSVPLVAACILGAAGIGFGAWTAFERFAAPRPSAIRMGPVAEMPEIRGGVPALVRGTAQPVAAASPDGRPAAATADGRPVRMVGGAPVPAPSG